MLDSLAPRQKRLSAAIQRAMPVRFIIRHHCYLVFIALLCFLGFAFRTVFTPPASKPVPAKWVDKRFHWEKYASVNRLYGGVRTLVPTVKNVPEYPTVGVDISRGKFHRPIPRDVDAGNSSATAAGAAAAAAAAANTATGRGSRRARSQKGGHDSQHSAHSNDKKSASKGPSMDSIVFNPYPDYTSPEYVANYGVKHDCYLDNTRNISIPPTRAFPGIPSGFPDPVMGSPHVLGLDHSVCFDRYGRYGPYGLGYNQSMGGTGASIGGDNEGNQNVWNGAPVDYRGVKWHNVQTRCEAANRERFSGETKDKAGSVVPKKRVPRTAVMLRTTSNFQYTQETIMWVRSLIAELSMHSGAEYTVHFLIDVKDTNLQIWADDEVYKSVLKDSLPEEFAGMGTLWSAAQMRLIYQNLEIGAPSRAVFYRSIYGAYRGGWLPMQYFAYRHPEYDYYWNLEMDVRYTGNWYHFFDKLGKWAKKQPRKGLWERNGRFYVPAEHGSWDEFTRHVEHQTTYGADSQSNIRISNDPNDKRPQRIPPKGERFIWGPERAAAPVDFLKADGEGIPPTDIAHDDYKWGVDEEADLISLNPLFDPVDTTWIFRNDIVGYTTESPSGQQPAVSYPVPRRTALVTNSRVSRRLLLAMHRESYQKHHHMMNEMWPPSCALQHGFKAVYAPHPMWFDRRWPTATLDSTFNAGKNGAVGGGRNCVFGAYEHNFRGASFFYNSQLPIELYRRWLGYKDSEGRGGEEFEKNGEGRMCLPPMLYHPIKPFNLAATKE